MAQYQSTYKLINTQSNATIGQERFNFNALDVSDSIKRATKHQRERIEYYSRNGGRFTLRLTNLKVFGAGHINNPKYDPATDICDDCHRPFWKGHNPRVEH